MATVGAGNIRTVALVGQGGAGKTRLAEGIVGAAGVDVGRGGLLDWEPGERERGHSLSTAGASVAWGEHRLELLDTPGTPDAVGEAYPALAAVDTAVFVVDAAGAVSAEHDELWATAEALALPRVVVLTKFDQERASYQDTIDALRARYGKPLAPVHMPVGVGAEFTGVIDLLHGHAVTLDKGRRVTGPIPTERAEQAARMRELLVEAIVENDDELLERYLEGDEPAAEELGTVFAHGIASCGFFPVLCAATPVDIGPRLLADFLVEECPSPQDRAVRDSSGAERPLDGPPAALVAKTLSDPYVGRISIVRVLTGELRQDDTMVVARSAETIRLGKLARLCGKEQTPVDVAGPGQLVAASKVESLRTGDTIHAPDDPWSAPTTLPPPGVHRVAIEPASAGDEEKLSTALNRLREEDPALGVERGEATQQLVLATQGPGHVDTTIERLERKFGVHVRTVPRAIAYRETLAGPASGTGRHVKQSGGSGQYGIAHIEAAPLERGAGFRFEDEIVGGVIPRQFIPSVEKGIVERMARGVRSNHPVVDVAVRLVDGKHHSVDSSQVAFETAGSLAFADAADAAGVLILEPIMAVAVTVADEQVGDVMGDLSARRGRILGSEPEGQGRTSVHAHVPEAELERIVPDLRSLTSGSGRVTYAFDHYDVVPEHLAAEIAARADQS